MNTTIRLEAVHYSYRGTREALCGVTLDLRPGERVAVLGNNGAGKSTLLQIMDGLRKPTSGRVLLDGKPVSYARSGLRRLRSCVGLVFQDPEDQLLAGTVSEEISFGPLNQGLSRKEAADRVEEAIAQFRLEPLRDRAPQYLSGGEKKRVALADVFAMHPGLLLLDEPTAGLDPRHSRELLDTLHALPQDMAILLSTHDLNFAAAWADRILLLSDGVVRADGDRETVFRDRFLLEQCGLEPPFLAEAAEVFQLPRIPRTREELWSQVREKE